MLAALLLVPLIDPPAAPAATAVPTAPAATAAPPAAEVFGRVRTAGEERLAEVLGGPAGLPDFFEQPVQDVLDALADENELTVVPLDDETRTLMTDGLTTQPPLRGIPLRAVLDLVLHPRGLDWYPRGGVLMIATRGQMRSQADTLVRIAPDAQTAEAAAQVLARLFEQPAPDGRTAPFTPRRTDPRDEGPVGPLQIAAFGKAVVVRGSWADLREVDAAVDQIAAGVGVGGLPPDPPPAMSTPPADRVAPESGVDAPPSTPAPRRAGGLGFGG